MSTQDYLEGMAQSLDNDRQDTANSDTSHRAKHNPLLKNAGMQKSQRKAFRKKNPGLDELYQQTYQQMDDREMREKFHSDDKKIIAAMAIASQRTAKDNHITANTIANLDAKTLSQSKFKEHYEQALKDIDEGLVNINAPNKFCSSQGLAELDEQKKVAALNKRSSANGRTSLVSTQVGCKTLECQLTKFTISHTPSAYDEALLLPQAARASNRVNEVLEEVASDAPASSDFTLNALTDTNAEHQFHFVGGYQNQFSAAFNIAVGGSCSHGDQANCPGLDIQSKQAKIDDLETHEHYFKNTDAKLKQLRLNPVSSWNDRSLAGLDKVIAQLKPKFLNKTPARYNFMLTSCVGSGEQLYTGYSPIVFIHPQVIQKLSLTLVFKSTFSSKFRIEPSLSYVGRFDGTTYNYSIDADEAVKSVEKIMSNILGDNAFTQGLHKTAELLHRLKQIDKSDELEACAQPAEDEEEEFELSSIGGLDPAINFSYFRKTVNRPDLNYSEVGIYQSVFVSGSPLFKFEKEVNILSLIWRNAARLSLAVATGGLSVAARWSIQQLGVEENLQESFENFVALMKDAVVKEVKQAKQFVIDGLQELRGIDPGAEQDNVTSDEVSDFCSGQAAEGQPGTSVTCILKFNSALETDDPNGGLVWDKKPGDDQFTLNTASSGLYAGINATVEGEISSDLQFLKSFGLSQAQATFMSGGIEAKALAADKTGESRLGITFGYVREGDKAYDAEKGIMGLCRQTFYSGLAIFIDGFVWKTKSETAAKSRGTTRSSRGGEIQEGTVDDFVGSYKHYVKSLMNFCLIKPWEGDMTPIKLNPFSTTITE